MLGNEVLNVAQTWDMAITRSESKGQFMLSAQGGKKTHMHPNFVIVDRTGAWSFFLLERVCQLLIFYLSHWSKETTTQTFPISTKSSKSVK